MRYWDLSYYSPIPRNCKIPYGTLRLSIVKGFRLLQSFHTEAREGNINTGLYLNYLPIPIKWLCMTPFELTSEVEGLLSLPKVFLKTREIINNPKSTIDEVAFIINQDPNTTVHIRKIANWAFFGLTTETYSVNRAILLWDWHN